MSEQTKIAWCDSTVNFWEGCTKISAGCANCYAEARDKRFTGGIYWRLGRRRKSKSAVKAALALNRKPWICDVCSGDSDLHYDHSCTGKPEDACHTANVSWHRRRIFSLSLGDWLDDEVPIAWLTEMLDTIRQCDQVTWILCTKRPENFKERIARAINHVTTTPCTGEAFKHIQWMQGWVSGNRIPQNITVLTSVENQAMADARIPELLKIPAACRGLSLEPLLGLVDLNHVRRDLTAPLSWYIIGGESGPNSRPCNVDWIRSLVEQGKAAGVATFVKQLGAYPVIEFNDKNPLPTAVIVKEYAGKLTAYFSDKKGGNPAEWPADLRVQEWPKGF